MKMTENVIHFPAASFPASEHSLYTGGIAMKVTHQHPKYTSEQERLERLQDLKKTCAIKIHGLHNSVRSA